MFRTSPLVLSSFAVLSLSACGPWVQGSGRAAEEQRTVGAWKTLRVESGITAVVKKGDPGVTLNTDDNVLREVETFLEGTTLVVRVRPMTNIDSRLGISATVSGDVLEGVAASGAAVVSGAATPTPASFFVDASGSSTVRLTGVDTSAMRIEASGSSAVTASGRANTLDAQASGASIIDTRELLVDTASIHGSGASNLQIFARNGVSGSLSGASRLTWIGGGNSTVSTSGGSTASRGD